MVPTYEIRIRKSRFCIYLDTSRPDPLKNQLTNITQRQRDIQRQIDMTAITSSNITPHYCKMILENEAPAYTNQNLPFNIEKFMAQIRLEKLPT